MIKPLPKPEKAISTQYEGKYDSFIKSYWYDSDSGAHYHHHRNCLRLYSDGRVAVCPLSMPDIDTIKSCDVIGEWNATLNRKCDLEIELVLRKGSGLNYDPYLDIEPSKLKDIKYEGSIAQYGDFLKEGYYKGKIENHVILIHGQVFKKVE